eukprot:COSAG02_NODE_1512_length_12212_cov_4.145133_4_plen_163_part_00
MNKQLVLVHCLRACASLADSRVREARFVDMHLMQHSTKATQAASRPESASVSISCSSASLASRSSRSRTRRATPSPSPYFAAGKATTTAVILSLRQPKASSVSARLRRSVCYATKLLCSVSVWHWLSSWCRLLGCRRVPRVLLETDHEQLLDDISHVSLTLH